MSLLHLFTNALRRPQRRAFRSVLATLAVVSVTLSVVVIDASDADATGGFGDVPAGSYYSTAVSWARDTGVTLGRSEQCFDPHAAVTRAEFVAMLWRSAGEPRPGGSHSFVDVTADWQNRPVAWAVKQQLVVGIGDGRFAPDAPITRGDLVTILHRSRGAPAVPSHLVGGAFRDVRRGYHETPVTWALLEGVTLGTSPTTFSPEILTSRAQAVTFLWRYHGRPATVVSPAGDPAACGLGSGGRQNTGGAAAAGQAQLQTSSRSQPGQPSNPSPPGARVPAVGSTFDVSRYLVPAWGDGRMPNKGSNTGSFRFFCGVSHLSYDDPVVVPGQPSGAHLHMFFGNTEADAFSDYDSLRRSGNGTCQGGPINRSAYWTPALLNGDSRVLTPNEILVYYKVGKGAPNIEELPAGLVMIGGYDSATGRDHAHSWTCKANGRGGATIPNCPSGSEVHASIIFGMCWDGRLDSPDHRSHILESTADINAPCPASHPHRLPQFQIILRYISDGNTDKWFLSSDRHGGANHAGGRTLHADWFGAWDPQVLTTWTNECVNARRSCNAGEIGNGQQLSPKIHGIAPNTTVAPPPR